MVIKFLFIILSISFLLAADESDHLKVGLVLSGGGAKGFTHAGVLKVLDSLNVHVDYIAATSFGAIVGSLYAIGKTGKELETMGAQTDWSGVLSDLPARNRLPYFRKKESGKYQLKFGLDGVKPVTPTGFVQGQTALMELSQWYHAYEQVTDFSQFPIPFKCVAMDLITGNQVVMGNGSLTRSVRASFSIPTIFTPVEWGDSLLIDGGVINNLPVDIVKEMGADIVIAVNVASQNKKPSEINNIINVLEQSISVHEYELEYENEAKADLIIRPDLKGFHSSDFDNDKFLPMVERGYSAAVLAADELKKIRDRVGIQAKHESMHKLIKNPKISFIDIKGNNKLPFKFLYRLIGYEPGDIFNSKELENRINDIYSLGYFNTIFYEIELNDDNTIDLNILISEKSMREFNTGLRWDNRFGFVGAINIRINSTLIPGLVIEEHAQFAGIRKNILQIYYPSRTLDFPLYPFVRSYYDKYDIFLQSNTATKELPYSFESNGFGIGVGLLLKNYWTTEVEIRADDIKFKENYHEDIDGLSFSWQKNIYSKYSLHLDTIDDILLPTNGINVNIEHEYSQMIIQNDVEEYSWYSFFIQKYSTWDDHTLSFSSFYQDGSEFTPLYKRTIYGGNNLLTGFKENQLNGFKTGIAHIEYRYRHKKDIFFRLLASNILFNNHEDDDTSIHENLWGYGLGVTLTSPVGPLEFVWSMGPESFSEPNKNRFLFSFNAGYKF
ncbi:MAG: patatin-like phospholipase family protein [Candidatus Marinimicrobia bacterium]|nr:patatin-like phospholipase family protein [Candidatus Neomarinimicrobiota bacterium]